MKRVAVVQARMGSTRLPGKTLMLAAGKPMLQHLVERLRRARLVDAIVIATTDRPEDEAIERLCRTLEVGCYRGSSEDVLGRVTQAAQAWDAEVHIEIHGDGPLLDWRVIDQAVELFESGRYELVTNSLRITYPPGLDVWVYPTALLARAEREATAPAYRESPALYVTEQPERFRIHNFEAPPSLAAPDTYLELDTALDFEVLGAIVEALAPRDPAFTTEEILEWLRRHPELAARNRDVERRWKQVGRQAAVPVLLPQHPARGD